MNASRQRLINYSLNCKNNKEIPSFNDLYIFEWKIPKNLKFIILDKVKFKMMKNKIQIYKNYKI